MPIPEVAVLVETDSSWGRNVLRGVASYAQKFGPWNLLVESHDRGPSWAMIESWRADGVIARLATPLLLRQIQQRGVPAVDVGDLFVGAEGVDAVLTDTDAWAQLALDHFRSKGFEHFAYYAPPSRDYSKRRGTAFAAVVEAAGQRCAQYRPGYRVGREISREEHRRRVGRWLSQLPHPVAVLAIDAQRGKDLAEICTLEGYNVPDQVAILAGDSDELSCEICTPPLSSIDVASRRIGYEAAARLAARLEGGACLAEPLLIAPDGVHNRQSTDVLAIDDPLIVQALRYMQTHAYRGITVDDVLAVVPMARRQLERQFKKQLGRLPAEELRRLRLERGRQLLGETELPMDAVAEACGYAGSTQFGAAFRKHYGMTPLAYRRRLQSS
ncbi:Xylose operon regulatory protein [Botrimarina colliarenosi]|uniref:Xylose operon regulatory protein n=1 Tax=Botrimarina colliarenosi TaxID=2528001 RepID=A0A5C6A0R8_9BACT|nr:DNA-binding transcriptional regulator [Botrimarina colliarenosi]TWT93424.1 Xylose operon regulatory protein [Botrimarina colliarenosi]